MKNRLKILLLAGVLMLSAMGTAVFVYAEEAGANAHNASEPLSEPASETQTEPVLDTEPTSEPEPVPPQTEAPQPTEPVTEPITEGATSAPSTEVGTEATESESTTESVSETTETSAKKDTSKKDNKKKEEKIKKEAAKKYEEITGESIYVFGSYPVGDITENTNEIYDYLREVLGLNHAAACGVLANIQCESNFMTTAVGDGGTSYGLCQWHLERFSALINWCNANGYEYHSVQGQLGYLACELQGGYLSVYQYLLNVPDTAQGAYDAAYHWCMYFEIPSNIEYNSQMRADLAMNLYFPQTLGVQDDVEEKDEIVKLDEKQMEEILVEAPKNISKLSRLDISKEETVTNVIDEKRDVSSSAGTSSGTSSDRRNLEEETQRAVEQALKEYQNKKALREEKEPAYQQLQAEELALYGSFILKK